MTVAGLKSKLQDHCRDNLFVRQIIASHRNCTAAATVADENVCGYDCNKANPEIIHLSFLN